MLLLREEASDPKVDLPFGFDASGPDRHDGRPLPESFQKWAITPLENRKNRS
jgi:hypothetical protein